MVGIQIVVDDRSVEATLNRLDTVLSPVGIAGMLSGPVDEYLQHRAKERFRTEGDDVVGKWAPLSPATEAIRAQQGFGAAHPINRRRGELERYITETPGQVTPIPGVGAILDAPGAAATGTLKKKLRGAQKGEGTAPPRPVLGLNATDTVAITALMSQTVQRSMGL